MLNIYVITYFDQGIFHESNDDIILFSNRDDFNEITEDDNGASPFDLILTKYGSLRHPFYSVSYGDKVLFKL